MHKLPPWQYKGTMLFHTPSGQTETIDRIKFLDCNTIFHILFYIYWYHPIFIHLILKIQDNKKIKKKNSRQKLIYTLTFTSTLSPNENNTLWCYMKNKPTNAPVALIKEISMNLEGNGYMNMYGWASLLSTWNYHNIVNRLYSNIK